MFNYGTTNVINEGQYQYYGEQDVTQTASWSDKRSTQFCSPFVPVGEPATLDKPHTICMENYQYMITNGFLTFSLFRLEIYWAAELII